MISFRKPSVDVIQHFLATQAKLPFTYHAVGATAETSPAHYVVDRTRIKLGDGEAVFRSAIAALRRWEQFNLGWVKAWPSDTPIEKGQIVAVMGRAIGVWWLNACRVVYVVDEVGPLSRFGFAHGTLPGGATTACGTTSWRSLGPTRSRPVSATPSSAVCKSGLVGIRRHQCSEPLILARLKLEGRTTGSECSRTCVHHIDGSDPP